VAESSALAAFAPVVASMARQELAAPVSVVAAFPDVETAAASAQEH
jgi:hypothetical protein